VEHPGILIIEDDYDDASLTLRILKKYRIANYVESVRDPEEGFRLLRYGRSYSKEEGAAAGPDTAGNRSGKIPEKFRPELILIGYAQPRMPAMEVAIRLRDFPEMDQVPLIICCGTQEEENLVKQWGMRRVVSMSKPVGFFKLLECIQKLEMHWQVYGSKP
jgi:CheY-like chemotaxis protein